MIVFFFEVLENVLFSIQFKSVQSSAVLLIRFSSVSLAHAWYSVYAGALPIDMQNEPFPRSLIRIPPINRNVHVHGEVDPDAHVVGLIGMSMWAPLASPTCTHGNANEIWR